ncbi:MAG: ribosome biogenesis GTPase YlqF [Vulcanibacillus sp.]
MTIQWFPGHMAKARKEIVEKLKIIDVIIELLDARIPISSRNPMINEIVMKKPRLVLLNKYDLADPRAVKKWIDYFQKENLEAIPISSINGKGIANITKRSEYLIAEKREKMIERGINPRPVRAMILGIPNVGKSTLINRLASKYIANTGDRPGITKGQQWIKVGNSMDLLDTPGILWPKFEDKQVGFRLAATGAIKDELFHFDEIAFFIIEYFRNNYPKNLIERYNLTDISGDNIEIIKEIGKKRGCLISGGEIDFDKTSELIVRDLRTGKLGQFCLEEPSSTI